MKWFACLISCCFLIACDARPYVMVPTAPTNAAVPPPTPESALETRDHPETFVYDARSHRLIPLGVVVNGSGGLPRGNKAAMSLTAPFNESELDGNYKEASSRTSVKGKNYND